MGEYFWEQGTRADVGEAMGYVRGERFQNMRCLLSSNFVSLESLMQDRLLNIEHHMDGLEISTLKEGLCCLSEHNIEPSPSHRISFALLVTRRDLNPKIPPCRWSCGLDEHIG